MRVFIGYDSAEEVALHVLSSSIWRRASQPVPIIPLKLSQLPMTRERHPLQSTEFSFSRFLVPYLCGYKGWAVFMDCDMLIRDDIIELFQEADPQYAVQVVKHDYVPRSRSKFLGNMQTTYEKKNWSSVMLFNCEKCTALTPEAVNSESGLWLHQFKWLKNDEQIGELHPTWNHLVGEYPHLPEIKNIHYTEGGPWFDEYHDTDYADEWFIERERMLQSYVRSKAIKETDDVANV
ncbi:MAG: glycosyltransferase [Gammaproteobacteria bacterium]|nr:glycosyltransferase [Gammaproteobacteria bacterium]